MPKSPAVKPSTIETEEELFETEEQFEPEEQFETEEQLELEEQFATEEQLEPEEEPLFVTVKEVFESKDMGRHILSFLSKNDLEYMSSSEFEEMPILNTLAQDQRLWRNHIERHFPERAKTLEHHKDLDYQNIHAQWVKEESRKKPHFKLLLFIRDIVPGDFEDFSNEQIAEILAEHGFDPKDFFSRSSIWNGRLEAFATSKNQRILDYIYDLASGEESETIAKDPNELLNWAVACNQSEAIVNSLIGKEPIGSEPLKKAVQFGHRELCNNVKLIQGYESAKKNIMHHLPPMHLVCEYGHSNILADYIEKYPQHIHRTGYPSTQQNLSTFTLHTPFHIAVENGQLECLKLLIDANKRNLQVFQRLHKMSVDEIQRNFPGIAPNPFPRKTQGGDTLLHLAARRGFKLIIDELIKEHALDFIDINAINNSGSSALHYAIMTKNLSFIQYFLGLFGLDKSKHIEKTLELLAESDDNLEIFLEFYGIYYKSGASLETNNKLMMTAAYSNCPQILKAMLKTSPVNVNHINMTTHPNGTSVSFCTALHYALRYKNDAMVKDLLAVPGINTIYYSEGVSRPPLSLACAASQSTFESILEGTLAQLTDPAARSEFFRRQYNERNWNHVHVQDPENRTLLADAIKSNEVTKVNMLLPYTPEEIVRSEIRNAIRTNKLTIFLALLRPSLPVDATIIQKKMFFQTEGRSFLYDAAFHGSDKIAEWLLDNEAEVDASDDENRTPLFAAIEGNSLDKYPPAQIVNPVVKSNTSNQIRFLKSSAYSLKSGHIAIISELHDRGADFSMTLENGSTILHHAAQHGRLKTLEFLMQLEPRLSLLSQREDGDSPLSLAIKSDDFPQKYIVSSLLPKLTKTQRRDVEVQAHLLNATNHLSLIKQMHTKFKFNLHLQLRDDFSLLHKVAATHDVPSWIKYLLENKCDVNRKNDRGETPLYLGLINSKGKPVISTLLGAGARNVVTNDGSTMMHAIARGGRIDVLKLVEAELKLDVNAEDQQRRTPLFLVEDAGLARELIARGAELNWIDANKETPLHHAFRTRDPKLINTLLESIPSKEFATVVNQANKEGVTVLHIAAENNQIGYLEILTKHDGIDIDAVQHNQQTAMTIAANNGHWNIVKLLVEKRASVSAEVLYCAAKAGNTEMVTFLLTPLYASNSRKKQRKIYDGIDPNLLHEGWSPLHIAATHNHVGVLSVLLANGADIDLLSQNNVTALYIACQFGKIEAVRLLLEQGANMDIVCNGGLAIQIASTLEHKEIYDLLSKKMLDQLSLQGPAIGSSSASSSFVTGFSFFNVHTNGEAKQEKQAAATTAKKSKTTQNSPQTQSSSSSSFFTMPEAEDVEMVAEPKQLPAKRRNSETEAETEKPEQPKKAKSETSETEQRREREREIGGGDRSWLLDPTL